MKTVHRYTTLRILLVALCVGVAACVSATGPDGTDNVPALGAQFMQVEYDLTRLGQMDTNGTFTTLLTTAIKSTQDPLDPTAVALTDSLVQGDTLVIRPYGVNFYRFLPNGDVAVRHNSRLIEFTKPDTPFISTSVTLRDTFIVLPFGTKRDYTYTLLDTTVTESFGSRSQTTRHTVVDSINFLGPTMIGAPSKWIPSAVPMSAMHVKIQRAITSTATVESKNRISRTVRYFDYYYSPTRGYMVHQSVWTADSGGKARIVVPLPLP